MNNQADKKPIPITPGVEKLAACYQPILALDTRKIIGYEVLGRTREGEDYQTLGPFFTDSRVAVSEQMRIDRILREQAFAKLSVTPDPPLLFINLKPSWMYKMYQETGELLTLQLIRKYGIDPSRVVVEVTEEAFRGSMKALTEVIDVYRRYGCQIAIDDVGTGFSSADRIAQIRPSLLKVDIHMMKKSARHHGYFSVLRSFSTLAEQIGASLLIEGIETKEDLQRAIEIGARYVQGFLFSQAKPNFHAANNFSEMIESELERHRIELVATEHRWRSFANEMGILLRSTTCLCEQNIHTCQAPDMPEYADTCIEQILENLDSNCIRVYMCKETGIQLSSNYFRTEQSTWTRQTDYRGSNWSWRPYFISNLLHLEGRTEAMVSRTYTDLETQARIRTLSSHVGEGRVLFIDIIDTEAY